MARHSWANRVLPGLVIAIVVSCVWYAWQSRPKVTAAGPDSSQSTQIKGTSMANAQAIPAVSPVVEKIGQQVHLSIDASPFKAVQKVEFYIEEHFVGTAYAKPYTVTLSENNLAEGTHTVTAKIYTPDATTESKSASFNAKPAAPPAQGLDASDPDKVAVPSKKSATQPAPYPVTIASPGGLFATASQDGKTATLSWSAVAGTNGYRVIRDSNVIATVTAAGFTDTNLMPGFTYDYQVIAFNSSAESTASAMVAVTMPNPSVLGDSTDEPNSIQAPPDPNIPPATN